MKTNDIIPWFVKYIPEQLEPGKIYISDEYKVAVHLCACGCGGKTVTPIDENEWTVTMQGDKLTIRPSIGNWKWENPFHAHYFMTDNIIQWL